MPREHSRLRPSSRPLRVLAARRGVPDRGAGRPGRGVRPARSRPHRPRRDERRRRALQGGHAARHQADRGLRGLFRGRPRRAPRRPLRAQPPDPARRHRRGLPQPGQALLGRIPGGPAPRQARGGHGRPGRPLGRRDRAHRLPAVAHEPPHRRGPRARGPRAPRRPRPGLRRRAGLPRGPEERHSRAGPRQRGGRRVLAGHRAPAGRHRRRPLPGARGLRPPPGAAVRADQEHAREPEAHVRRPSPSGPRRFTRRWRSPTAATSRSSWASSSSRVTRHRPASRRPSTCASSSTRVCGCATAIRFPRRRASAPTTSSA
jgi:hypothetical protein